MNYTVRKGLGSILGNLTRQMLLTQWPSVRPIGYAVGDKSTVISAGSNVVEDMVEFSSSFCWVTIGIKGLSQVWLRIF